VPTVAAHPASASASACVRLPWASERLTARRQLSGCARHLGDGELHLAQRVAQLRHRAIQRVTQEAEISGILTRDRGGEVAGGDTLEDRRGRMQRGSHRPEWVMEPLRNKVTIGTGEATGSGAVRQLPTATTRRNG
jgi:hypothetical protein